MIKALSPLNILLLGNLKQYSGNSSTAIRIRHYFEEEGYFCVGKDISHFKEKEQFVEYLHREEIQVILGIHALHTGPLVKDVPVPYGIIFGGTDLNENSKDPEKLAIMTECVEKAKSLVAFSPPMEAKAKKLWPEFVDEKLTIIPQAVKTNKRPSLMVTAFKEHYNLDMDAVFFTIVGGIRPAKDPIQLLPVFTHWHQLTNRKVFLVIIGPKVDANYFELFEEIIDGTPGIIYLGSQTTCDTHALVRESFALINSSISEGMALSILEAMDLEVPVIARNIPGNSALIEDNVTGILYTGPEDFIEKAEELLRDDERKRQIVKSAKERLLAEHGCAVEKDAYVSIVNHLKAAYSAEWYEEYTKVEELEEDPEEAATDEGAENATDDGRSGDKVKPKAHKPHKNSLKKSKWDKVTAENLHKLQEGTGATGPGKRGEKSPRSEKPSDGHLEKDAKSKDSRKGSKWEKVNTDDLKKLNGKPKPETNASGGKGVSQARKSPMIVKKRIVKQEPERDTSDSNPAANSNSKTFKLKPNAEDTVSSRRKPVVLPKVD